MKKKDIKSGMVVKFSNGKKGIVFEIYNITDIKTANYTEDPRCLMMYDGYMPLGKYNEDLICEYGDDEDKIAFDIDFVYKIKGNLGAGIGKNYYGEQHLIADSNLQLLWSRY